jgi:hypothetical protein
MPPDTAQLHPKKRTGLGPRLPGGRPKENQPFSTLCQEIWTQYRYVGVSTRIRIRIRLSIGSLSQTPIKFVLDYTDMEMAPEFERRTLDNHR